ncbi:MAG TPA: hypothetical protein EYP53_01845 [Candidatus Latescibacteria bacterium]|nr:hypothetical protein [Candidatus Latescibacterota bacterium]
MDLAIELEDLASASPKPSRPPPEYTDASVLLTFLVCQGSDLPLFFFLTPANAADCPWALPLMLAVVMSYRLPIRLVWADAAYFSRDIFGFIRELLKASFAIDYNLRRKGKKYLATFLLGSGRGSSEQGLR